MPLRRRRDLLEAAAGAAACAALGWPTLRGSRAHAQAAAEAGQLAANLYLVGVGGCNVVAQTGADGLLLVDGGPPSHGGELLGRVAALPGGGGAVHTLINTHWHPEQTGLNERLGRAGARIVAQANTRLWLRSEIVWPWNGQRFDPLPDAGLPNETFYDAAVLETGGTSVEVGYQRHCPHTDGDLYVRFADANVLAVGDGVSGEGWPVIDWWTGGWIGGVVGGLELLLSLSDAATRIVPARGPVLARADLEHRYEIFSTVYERLAELLYSGRGPDEAVAARPTREFDAEMGPSDTFVRRAFESLWGYLSPDA